MLAPYLHSKMGVTPAPIYLDHEVHIPHPQARTLSDLRENILYLTNLKLTNQIDQAYGDNLILDQTRLHDSILEEQKLLYATNSVTEQTLIIQTGLPPLPGSDVIMPQLNGHPNGHELLQPPGDHPDDPGPAIDASANPTTTDPGSTT